MKKVISTPNAPAAIGPYSQAIAFGDMLITSGQLGLDPKSGAFVSEDVSAQTEQVFRVKTTCFLADMGDFAAMNAVYEKHFSGAFPARSAVAVKTLPKGGLVEIEVIAHK